MLKCDDVIGNVEFFLFNFLVDSVYVAEASKWEKITYLGAASCTALAVYCLSKGHPHYEEPPVRTSLLL